jgi:hypothetical protein
MYSAKCLIDEAILNSIHFIATKMIVIPINQTGRCFRNSSEKYNSKRNDGLAIRENIR